mmetsp:Transcript_6400/g.8904  ORF Transcript_6400/g.8904 Transcript_6400/m.8904 type:complete len:215 (-) Transcript_6400:195-839(-)
MLLIALIFSYFRGLIWIPSLWLGSTLITFENLQKILKNEDYRTKEKILEAIFQMILAQLFPPIYPLFCVAKTLSDHIWKPTPLHSVKKSVLLRGIDTKKHLFSWTGLSTSEIQAMVDQFEVVDGEQSLFHTIVLGNSSHACCIENTIYVRGKVLWDGVLRHEATHAAQFQVQKGRFCGFLTVSTIPIIPMSSIIVFLIVAHSHRFILLSLLRPS